MAAGGAAPTNSISNIHLAAARALLMNCINMPHIMHNKINLFTNIIRSNITKVITEFKMIMVMGN